MARTDYRIHDATRPYFLTDTIVAWLPLFAQPRLVEVIFDSWRFLQRDASLQLMGFVILENHVHWIARADDLPRQIRRFKSYTARQCIDELERLGFRTFLQELRFFRVGHKREQHHQFWQESRHPQEIRSTMMLRQKLEYIHLNPVRRGYVDDPAHWRYSSARNYMGLPGLIEVDTQW